MYFIYLSYGISINVEYLIQNWSIIETLFLRTWIIFVSIAHFSAGVGGAGRAFVYKPVRKAW